MNAYYINEEFEYVHMPFVLIIHEGDPISKVELKLSKGYKEMMTRENAIKQIADHELQKEIFTFLEELYKKLNNMNDSISEIDKRIDNIEDSIEELK